MGLIDFLGNNKMNNGNTIVHNSVEDLIRSTLGANFIDSKKSVEPPKPEEIFPSNIPDIDAIIRKSEERLTQKSEPLFRKISTPKIPGRTKPIEFEPESIEIELDIDEPIEEPIIQRQQQEEPREFKIQYDKESKEYVLTRDRDETFECQVNIEGGSSTSPVSRIIIKTDIWNLIFEGTIKRDGTCVVPLKKLHIFPEGTTGKIFLEVIVDDMVFVPWERPFRMATSKKVSISKPRLK